MITMYWGTSMLLLFIAKGDGKVGFSKTPKNLQKMDIIEKYLLGCPILEKKCKCYTILESSHD